MKWGELAEQEGVGIAITLFMATLVLFVGIYAFVAWVAMLAWNVFAAHFGFPLVTFWVAVAVVFLLGFLRPRVQVSK